MDQLVEELNAKKPPAAVFSTKDEGYHSKTGESFMQESEFSLDLFSGNSLLRTDDKNVNIAKNTNTKIQFDNENFDLTKPLEEIQRWDNISKTVERFSHNTITLLSWIDEMEEISRKPVCTSPFYNSEDVRKASVKKHIAKLLKQVRKDALLLLRDLPSENQTINTVMEKLESRCRELDVQPKKICLENQEHYCVNNASNPCKFISFSSNNLPSSSVSSKWGFEANLTSTSRLKCRNDYSWFKEEFLQESSSPSSVDLDVGKPTLNGLGSVSTNNRRNLSLKMNWMKFIREHKSIRDWLKKMDKLINEAEKSDVSLNDLQNLFKDYLNQFIISKPKRDLLNIKANYIETMFPEARESAESKMTEIDDWWNGIMLRLSNYLTPCLNDTNGSPSGSDCKSSSSKTCSLHLAEKNLRPVKDNGDPGKQDFNSKFSSISVQVQQLDRWLHDIESEAYKRENSVTIGWNPDRLKQLLNQNKKQQAELTEELSTFNRLTGLRNGGNDDIADISVAWSAIILQQRYFNLMLFLIDVECIIERRVDAIEKESVDKFASHSMKGIWTDRGMDMTLQVQVPDESEAEEIF